MTTLLERFWKKTVALPNGCVLWTGSRKKVRGQLWYGFFGANGKTVMTHRWIYEQTLGPQPGLVVMHSCDNPGCVNVEHLRVGTQADNMHDCAAKRRRWKGDPLRAHCVHGHPLTEENTYRRGGTGRRECRICRRAQRLRYLEERNPRG